MYRKASRKYTGGSALPDYLHLLTLPLPDDDDDFPVNADEEEPESWEGGDIGLGESSSTLLGVEETSEDDHRSTKAAPPAVTKRSGLDGWGNREGGEPKQRRIVRFNPNRDLAVEVGLSNLAWVLSGPQRIFIVAEVGDADETGWRPVNAVSVERAPRIDRHGPCLKRIPRTPDEIVEPAATSNNGGSAACSPICSSLAACMHQPIVNNGDRHLALLMTPTLGVQAFGTLGMRAGGSRNAISHP